MWEGFDKSMVDYSIFPLDEEIKDKLAKLEISYAFQPIFYPDGKDIYAYEALMRPKNIGVMDLIEEFRIKNDLHTLRSQLYLEQYSVMQSEDTIHI
mgnify:CR=1 FL=1